MRARVQALVAIQRGHVGQREVPQHAQHAAGGIADESGLSLAQVVASEPYLSANYVNNGARVVLPSRRSGLSVPTVIGADPNEHEIETYSKRLGSGDG